MYIAVCVHMCACMYLEVREPMDSPLQHNSNIIILQYYVLIKNVVGKGSFVLIVIFLFLQSLI